MILIDEIISNKSLIVLGDKLFGFGVCDSDEEILMIKINSLFFIG